VPSVFFNKRKSWDTPLTLMSVRLHAVIAPARWVNHIVHPPPVQVYK
jgi:hypothetical protein